MIFRYLVAAIAISISALAVSACQSSPSYDNRPAYGGNDYGGGGSSGY